MTLSAVPCLALSTAADASPGSRCLARVSPLPDRLVDPERDPRDLPAPEGCLAAEYAGGPWLGALVVGTVLRLTDPDLHAADAEALVVEVTRGPGETTVKVLLEAA